MSSHLSEVTVAAKKRLFKRGKKIPSDKREEWPGRLYSRRRVVTERPGGGKCSHTHTRANKTCHQVEVARSRGGGPEANMGEKMLVSSRLIVLPAKERRRTWR